MTLTTHSAAETRALGERLARQLQPGDVLLLRGRMGAGKSELTRGIARGLGVEGHVVSPTFTIMQLYGDGRLPLYHFDWYRLQGAEELYELSMEEYLLGDGVAVVEWPEMAEDAVPEKRLEIALELRGEDERAMTLKEVGGFRALNARALLQPQEA